MLVSASNTFGSVQPCPAFHSKVRNANISDIHPMAVSLAAKPFILAVMSWES